MALAGRRRDAVCFSTAPVWPAGCLPRPHPGVPITTCDAEDSSRLLAPDGRVCAARARGALGHHRLLLHSPTGWMALNSLPHSHLWGPRHQLRTPSPTPPDLLRPNSALAEFPASESLLHGWKGTEPKMMGVRAGAVGQTWSPVQDLGTGNAVSKEVAGVPCVLCPWATVSFLVRLGCHRYCPRSTQGGSTWRHSGASPVPGQPAPGPPLRASRAGTSPSLLCMGTQALRSMMAAAAGDEHGDPSPLEPRSQRCSGSRCLLLARG